MYRNEILKYLGEDPTHKTVESVFQEIEKDCSIKIGKKRRSKIKTEIKELLDTAMSAMSTDKSRTFVRKLREFGKLERIDLASGVGIALSESKLVISPFSLKPNLRLETILGNENWHLILVHRQRKFQKKDIVEAFHDVVKPELFVPYGYREGLEFHYFLIQKQTKALQKLVDAGLIITVERENLEVAIKTSVAPVKTTEKKLADDIIESIIERMNSPNFNKDSKENTLDLSNFSDALEPKDIIFSLSNKGCFNVLCDQVNGIYKLQDSFRTFKFANNGICSLEPLTKIFGVKMNVLDLSNNRIPLQDLIFLKDFEVKHLNISGNDISVQFFRQKIHEILPGLITIDGVPQNPIIPSPLIVESKLKPPSAPAVTQAKPKFRNDDGTGNDPIPQIEDGIPIRGDVRKGHDFSHLKTIFSSYRNDSMWTQVMVHHGNAFTWEEILDEIIPSLNNNPFFPCYYKRFDKHDEFYLYRNFDALSTMMMNNLEYDVPGKKKLTLSFRMNAAKFNDGQVDWFRKIRYVLTKRIQNNILELNDFVNDPEFEKLTICMGLKSTLEFILENVKKQNSQIVRINACRNGIKNLDGLQGLTLTYYGKLQTLDLRENKISDLAGVNLTSSIKELMLDGNPICEKFSSPREYIAIARKFFTELEWLDGYHLNQVLDLCTIQNYLVTRDAYTIAEEFVKTFFPIYDSFERHRLLDIYDEKSLFTLSVHYEVDKNQLANQDSNIFHRIQKYTKLSRNISTTSDMTRASNNVMCGNTIIRKVFDELPKTNHDFTTFCIDVPQSDSRMTIITVSGIYSESGGSLNESALLLGFVRTFILRPGNNNTYTISNDQVFIHNPSQTQKEKATVSNIKLDNQKNLEKMCVDLMPTEMEEKEMKLIMYRELTQLKVDECIRQLEQSFYEIKVALAIFNTLMDSGAMGDEKFDYK